MQTKKQTNVYTLTTIAVMTAVICILSPFSIAIGVIPITFATLAVYLSVYLLGWKKATVSVLLYILIGLAGLPVFSGFTGGFAKLVGPTGGYLLGYLCITLTAGFFIDRFQKRWLHLSGLLAGTALCYTLGTAWYCIQTGSALVPALGLCVLPFIPGDLLKISAVLLIGPVIKSRLREQQA